MSEKFFSDGILNGRVAFVTGGGTGITGGIARALAEAGARHELAVAGLADQIAALDDHLATQQDRVDVADDLGPLVEVVVRLRLLVRGGDRVPLRGVEDDEVRIRADRNRPFARVEPEELRRVRAEQLDHPVERDTALADPEVVDHVQPVLEPRPAVRDLGEVVLAERLLAVPEERAVVGRDRGEHVGAHGVPEHVLVRLVPRRRRVDVLAALEVRPLEERLVDEEVLRAALAPDRPALLARERDRVERLLAGDVDDVERRAVANDDRIAVTFCNDALYGDPGMAGLDPESSWALTPFFLFARGELERCVAAKVGAFADKVRSFSALLVATRLEPVIQGGLALSRAQDAPSGVRFRRGSASLELADPGVRENWARKKNCRDA